MRLPILLTFSFFTLPLLAQDSDAPNRTPAPAREQTTSSQAGARSEALDNAPLAVKQQVLRHAEGQKLEELSADNINGLTIYEALFRAENSETRLRMAENGAPISLVIAGTGERVTEPAAAERPAGAQAQTQAAPAAARMGVPQAVLERVHQQFSSEQIQTIQPKTFYQINIRQDGNIQQVWADENGNILK